MSFRRGGVSLLIVAAAVVAVLTAIISNRLFSGMVADVEADRFDMMRSILVNNIGDAEDRALARAEMIAALPSVQTLLAAGDREGLLAETQGMYKISHDKFGVDQAQFHVPPATSFLRLNDPAKFGDDLSTFRPIVVDVNKEEASAKGVTVSRSGPALVGCASIKNAAGEHVGSFEIGLEFGAMLDGLHNKYGFDGAVYIDEKLLRDVATSVPGDVLTDKNRVGKYIRFHTTHTDLSAATITDADLASGEEQHYIREAYGLPYGVVAIPIVNHTGKQLGMIALVGDFSASRASASRMMVWQGLLALFATVLSAGWILMVVRGTLLRPVDQIAAGLEALANGDRDKEIDSEGFSDEMKALVAAYDKIRKGGEA